MNGSHLKNWEFLQEAFYSGQPDLRSLEARMRKNYM